MCNVSPSVALSFPISHVQKKNQPGPALLILLFLGVQGTWHNTRTRTYSSTYNNRSLGHEDLRSKRPPCTGKKSTRVNLKKKTILVAYPVVKAEAKGCIQCCCTRTAVLGCARTHCDARKHLGGGSAVLFPVRLSLPNI